MDSPIFFAKFAYIDLKLRIEYVTYKIYFRHQGHDRRPSGRSLDSKRYCQILLRLLRLSEAAPVSLSSKLRQRKCSRRDSGVPFRGEAAVQGCCRA